MTSEPILLLFDIDGTLLHTEGRSRQAVTDAFTQVLGAPADFSSYSFSGRTDYRIFTDLLAMMRPDLDGCLVRDRLFPAYLRLLDDNLRSLRVTVYPGIEALLERLAREPACAVALLTGNQRRGAGIKLHHAGLEAHFPGLTGAFGDASLEREPLFPVAMEVAARGFGRSFAPSRTLVIGDSIHDIRCARAGGAPVLAVATGYTTREELAAEQPDLLLDSVADTDGVMTFITSLGCVASRTQIQSF
ncbi:HAD family hydrolase [bacterium]|nr:HAD family hydrolase [candidate division CSSED10-310 bacterium]